MSIYQRFVKNAVLSTVAEATTVFLFLLLIFAARFLGDEKYGVFAFALAFVGLFELICDCGLRFLLVRDLARDQTDARAYLGNVLVLTISLSLVSLCLSVLTVNILKTSYESRMIVYILQCAIILKTMKSLFRFSFHAFNRFDLAALTVFIERLLLFVVGIGILVGTNSVIAFAIGFLIVRIIDLGTTFLIFTRNFWKPSIRFDFSRWPHLLANSMPIALNGVFIVLLTRVDTVMISVFRSDAEVGWYNAATKLIEASGIVTVILGSSIFPSLAALFQQSKESFIELASKGVRYILVMAIPLALVGNILADKIIMLVFGMEYTNSIIAFRILLLGVIFSFYTHIGGAFLVAMNKQKIAVICSSLALGLNIILNSLLIPSIGYVGAAVASLVSYCALAVSIIYYLSSKGYDVHKYNIAIKPIIGAACAGIVAIGCKSFPVILTVILSVVLYLVVLTVIKFWNEEEKAVMIKYYGLLKAQIFPN
jgi:O-antigen/teichoic acid export membrane protein